MRYRKPYYPEPQAIDPASGFKVPLSSLVKQWDGELIHDRFVDKRNPQDFVRGVKDRQDLPYARPETPDIAVALNLITEDGQLIYAENGIALTDQGVSLEL